MADGFYGLTSGVITQNRILDTVSNNMANTNSNGFKRSDLTTSTFGQMMIDRIDSQATPIGKTSIINTVDQGFTDFSQGIIKETGRSLDFAVQGSGFFAIKTANGIVYTRNGSFNLDDQGYLILKNVGRVMGKNGEIRLGTANINADSSGNLYVNNKKVAQLGIYSFNSTAELKHIGETTYSGNNPIQLPNALLLWKNVEGSNVDTATELTNAISAQRDLQSCTQALKMVDQVLGKATTEIAKL